MSSRTVRSSSTTKTVGRGPPVADRSACRAVLPDFGRCFAARKPWICCVSVSGSAGLLRCTQPACPAGRQCERLVRAGEGGRPVSFSLEQNREHLAHCGIVLDDQDRAGG